MILPLVCRVDAALFFRADQGALRPAGSTKCRIVAGRMRPSVVARQDVKSAGSATHDLLVSQGYKLIEDAWVEHGRLTYTHDDDSTRMYVGNLARVLKSAGWDTDPGKTRAFRHSADRQEIELEPGGAEVTGHFLHHMKGRPG
jgi:hypothetical protein